MNRLFKRLAEILNIRCSMYLKCTYVYGTFQAVSTKLRPSLFVIFIFLLFYRRNRRAMTAIIDSFKIYTIYSLMRKKVFLTYSITSRALFRYHNQKKLQLFLYRLRWKGHIPCVQIFFKKFDIYIWFLLILNALLHAYGLFN